MEDQKIIYMTREEIKGLDRSKIQSMQMTSGATILISHENENIDYSNNENQPEIKLRARKEVKNEEEKEEEKPEEKKEEENPKEEEKPKEEGKEEKVEIEIEAEGKEEKDKKEVLRGPDGKPLLSEMLIYGGVDYGAQGQTNDNNVNLYPVPQNYEPIIQPNMPGNKNIEYPPQVQPQPQPQTDMNMMTNQNQMDYNNQNQAQNYPQQEVNNNQGYQSADVNNQNMQNPFEGQNDYNQNIPQPQQENIPVPNIPHTNIPQPQQENIPIPDIPQQNTYPEYNPDLEQQQQNMNMNYPEFNDQPNNNMMTQPEMPQQTPAYQPPYQQQQPIEPITPSPQKDLQYNQPQYEQYPPQMEPQIYPQEERPPMQPPMKPPMYPQMKPPMQRPMRPPMYQPPMQDYYYPGKKRIFPKPNFVQINIGGPQPYGYHVPKMIPHGPKHLFVPHGMGYRRPVDPVGEIIDFVADPVGYMVEKSLGLRSNKPKGKEGDKKDGEKKE